LSGGVIQWGGDQPFTSRTAIGYDHGYDGELFYLGLALDPAYIEGFIEGCLERLGEDNPTRSDSFGTSGRMRPTGT
jgi:hypothetical protein